MLKERELDRARGGSQHISFLSVGSNSEVYKQSIRYRLSRPVSAAPETASFCGLWEPSNHARGKMLSLMLYSLTSMTLSAVVVLYAVATRIRFYPVVVFLFTSKIASVTMVNLALVFTILLGVGFVRVFFGKLRDAETEAVWENMRYSMTETAFALSTFRDEVNARVGVLFGLMLFAKVFHLLNEARVEHVEQAHQTTWKVHARMIALFLTLFSLNGLVLTGCMMHVSTYGPSVYILFAFEHAVLLLSLITTLFRYAIAVYDLNFVHGRWQNKSQYEMYLALITVALQFTAYSIFAGVVFTYYGFPFHLIRSLYMTFKMLTERAMHFVRYRRIMHSLNERFPDATEEELNATDRVCIICREDMELAGPAGTPKKLDCGHLFHSICLQNWLERQFTCPTCRRPIPMGLPAQQEPAQAQPQPVPAGAAAVQPQAPIVEQPVQAAAAVAAPADPQVAMRRQNASNAALARANAEVNGRANRRVDLQAQREERDTSDSSDSEGEEEKTSSFRERSEHPLMHQRTASNPLSPTLPPRSLKSEFGLDEDVLFEDASLNRTSEEDRLKTRTRLLELEERVYQAQALAARQAQEFALKVLQLQLQQQQQNAGGS